MITDQARRRLGAGLALSAALLAPVAARAEIVLPAGFTARIYVTGDGFGGSTEFRGRRDPHDPYPRRGPHRRALSRARRPAV